MLWSAELLSRADSVTLRIIACQAPLFMRFSRQEYWSELPFPPLGGLPNPGVESVSLVSVSCIGRQILYHCTAWQSQRV